MSRHAHRRRTPAAAPLYRRLLLGFLAFLTAATVLVVAEPFPAEPDSGGVATEPAGRWSHVSQWPELRGRLSASLTRLARTRAAAPPPAAASPSAGTPPAATPPPTRPETSAAPVPAADTPPAPTPAPVDAPRGGALSWAPPQLQSPETITLSSSRTSVTLDDRRDYVIDLPDTPLDAPNGVSVTGGRNVVIIGGEIRTSVRDGEARGLYLKNQRGTVHVEGLRLSGAQAMEGINLAQPYGATVQLQNIRVDAVHGSNGGHHADVLQTWSGPARLRIDRLEGWTTYQGFFLDPLKFGAPAPELFDLRNVVLRDVGGVSAYLLWDSGTYPITTRDVTVVPAGRSFPGQVLWSQTGAWGSVRSGTSATPSPLTGNPGVGYVSPGYGG
ncbi:hypothetical protein [Blastococcus sp. SYSU D00695]